MTKLTFIENGPLLIEGDLEIQNKELVPPGEDKVDRVAVCRCGLSKNGFKCDASHKTKKNKHEITSNS